MWKYEEAYIRPQEKKTKHVTELKHTKHKAQVIRRLKFPLTNKRGSAWRFRASSEAI